jgi:hypothetical protein
VDERPLSAVGLLPLVDPHELCLGQHVTPNGGLDLGAPGPSAQAQSALVQSIKGEEVPVPSMAGWRAGTAVAFLPEVIGARLAHGVGGSAFWHSPDVISTTLENRCVVGGTSVGEPR